MDRVQLKSNWQTLPGSREVPAALTQVDLSRFTAAALFKPHSYHINTKHLHQFPHRNLVQRCRACPTNEIVEPVRPVEEKEHMHFAQGQFIFTCTRQITVSTHVESGGDSLSLL